MRKHHITLTGHTSKNHHSLGKFSLHDTRSILWTVCKPSIIQRVVLLNLANVFFIGKEPDCLWLSRMFHFAKKFLPLCQTIISQKTEVDRFPLSFVSILQSLKKLQTEENLLEEMYFARSMPLTNTLLL